MSVVFDLPQSNRIVFGSPAAGTTVISYNFPLQDGREVDLRVARIRAGVRTVLTLNAAGADGYSVAGAGEPTGGSIILSAPSLAGDQFELYGRAKLERQSAYEYQGQLRSEALDADMTRLTMIAQELRRDSDENTVGLQQEIVDRIEDVDELESRALTLGAEHWNGEGRKLLNLLAANEPNAAALNHQVAAGDVAAVAQAQANAQQLFQDLTTVFTRGLLSGAPDAATFRELVGLVLGLHVQGYNPILDEWIAKARPAGAVVGDGDAQTLTDKTLIEPHIQDPTGLVKADIAGIENLDNTADIDKIISNLVQEALDLKIPLSQKGQAGGVTPLGGDNKVPSQYLNIGLGLNYQGGWNAATNTPAIASGVGTTGDFYVVQTAGTTVIDGINSWAVGDKANFNGTVWEKIGASGGVTAVAGLTGAPSAGDLRAALALVVGQHVQAFSLRLAGLAAVAGNGLFAQTSTNAFAARSIAASGGLLSVQNANGANGDPTIVLTPSTNAQAIAGEDHTTALTPLRSEQHFAARHATNLEAIAGLIFNRFMSPLRVQQHHESKHPSLEETLAGLSSDQRVSPLRLKQFFEAQSTGSFIPDLPSALAIPVIQRFRYEIELTHFNLGNQLFSGGVIDVTRDGAGHDISEWVSGGAGQLGSAAGRANARRTLLLPPKTALFHDDGAWDRSAQGVGGHSIFLRWANNWNIKGYGYVSELKAADGSLYQPLSVSDCDNWAIEDVSLNGNRLGVHSTNNGMALRIGGGCTNWTLHRVRSINSPSYGMGAQVNGTSNSVFKDGRVVNCDIEECGDDGWDIKNALFQNRGLIFAFNRIKNPNRNKRIGEVAGADFRMNALIIGNIITVEGHPADQEFEGDYDGLDARDMSGIRIRNSGSNDGGLVLGNQVTMMTNGPQNIAGDWLMVGIDAEAKDMIVTGNQVTFCDQGIGVVGTGTLVQGNILHHNYYNGAGTSNPADATLWTANRMYDALSGVDFIGQGAFAAQYLMTGWNANGSTNPKRLLEGTMLGSLFTGRFYETLQTNAALGNNPFTTTVTPNPSPIVTVAHVGHGRPNGASVSYSGAAAVGGITPVGPYVITVTGPDSYTFNAGVNATSGATGGGAGVAAAYRHLVQEPITARDGVEIFRDLAKGMRKWAALPPAYANDAAAQGGGVAIGELYRKTDNTMVMRVA